MVWNWAEPHQESYYKHMWKQASVKYAKLKRKTSHKDLKKTKKKNEARGLLPLTPTANPIHLLWLLAVSHLTSSPSILSPFKPVFCNRSAINS